MAYQITQISCSREFVNNFICFISRVNQKHTFIIYKVVINHPKPCLGGSQRYLVVLG